MRRKMIVLNIGTTTQGQLEKHFSQFGEIEDAVVLQDGATRQPKGYGFIVFKEQSAADQCLALGRHEVNGAEVKVAVADQGHSS